MDVTRIIAIRHGETAWNVDTRIQGQLDIPLNDTGRWQAERLARALAAREAIDVVYTSDLLRAWETARPVAAATGAPLHTDEGLRERGFGSFQGKTFTEIEAAMPDEARRWRQRDPFWAPPGGESLTAMRRRVIETLHALASRHVGEQIASLAVDLAAIHRDPFDRMIIATTLIHDANLISLDGVFHHYPELQDRLLA